ncbi:hypothetical protein CORC01_06264 [Colletotrichum orchidophilum]|uniref:Monooxygenase n=1 Tax=Colletotrichum orchidophilum TaxID=1209926 RepID=A0A1G4BAP5_9PEZI|nr:uncharacterized protein CORC01_06264 [Colletotrichum orchidophilum]OHE98473.1 hypothetical protein CORC01_06264 [Colletotrichum orchidophilum]
MTVNSTADLKSNGSKHATVNGANANLSGSDSPAVARYSTTETSSHAHINGASNGANGSHIDQTASEAPETNRQRLRITIIGAGVSGISMAYKLQKHLKDYVEIQILEKSPELGGTWFENRYPGCACDVPSHCYQFSFAPNPDWSRFYASSQEIQAYLDGVARHFDLHKFIKFNTLVTKAEWSEDSGTWSVNTADGSTLVSEILVNASGILNNFQMPNIQGFENFAGPVLHTANWDSSVNLSGQRVGVIGAGASSVQLLPQIQTEASQISVFIRTPSWISPPVALSEANKPGHTYGTDEKRAFRDDGEDYLETRKGLESQFNGMFQAFFKADPGQKNMRQRFETRMRSLIQDKALQEQLVPKFEAGCRRINPGERYLLTLQEPNVEPVFDGIERITSSGIVAGGIEYPADVLIAATGFNTSFRPRFPILGRNGVNMQDLWADEPVSYFGTAVSGFPNYMVFLGPNTPISNGSLMGPIEATGDYFIRILSKVIRQRVKSFDVRPEAQSDFDRHTQEFMKHMVWTGTCRSWFKKGITGKVSALWPGSSLHYMQCLAEDRWEDYEWRYDRERYSYWRDGFSWIEQPEKDPLGIEQREYATCMTTIPHRSSDLSFYLQKAEPLPPGVIAFIPHAHEQKQYVEGDLNVAKKVEDYVKKEASEVAKDQTCASAESIQNIEAIRPSVMVPV